MVGFTQLESSGAWRDLGEQRRLVFSGVGHLGGLREIAGVGWRHLPWFGVALGSEVRLAREGWTESLWPGEWGSVQTAGEVRGSVWRLVE